MAQGRQGGRGGELGLGDGIQTLDATDAGDWQAQIPEALDNSASCFAVLSTGHARPVPGTQVPNGRPMKRLRTDTARSASAPSPQQSVFDVLRPKKASEFGLVETATTKTADQDGRPGKA